MRDELERRLRELGATKVNLLALPGNTSGNEFRAALGYVEDPMVTRSKVLS